MEPLLYNACSKYVALTSTSGDPLQQISDAIKGATSKWGIIVIAIGGLALIGVALKMTGSDPNDHREAKKHLKSIIFAVGIVIFAVAIMGALVKTFSGAGGTQYTY